MVSTDAERVASNDEIKAAMLDYLYEQPDHSSTWEDVHAQLTRVGLRMRGGSIDARTWNTLNELEHEGLVQISWRYMTWQLSVNGWLAMTRSRQLSSAISTSSPIAEQPGTTSTYG